MVIAVAIILIPSDFCMAGHITYCIVILDDDGRRTYHRDLVGM